MLGFLSNRTKRRIYDIGLVMCMLGEAEVLFLSMLGDAVERREPIRLNPQQVDSATLRSYSGDTFYMKLCMQVNGQGVVTNSLELHISSRDKWLYSALEHVLQPWAAVRTNQADGRSYALWISGSQATKYREMLQDGAIKP